MRRNAPQRVALVHDWLTGMRGGERCLEVFAELLPDAPILTLIHEPGAVGGVIERRKIVASKLSQWSFARRHYRRLLPLFPWAVGTLPSTEFDLVISLSHCAAKAVPVDPAARHICYCFTPARYLWDHSDTYFHPERTSAVVRAGARLMLPQLRRWDQRTASTVDRFVAISHHVGERIERCYGQPAEVIYPPVDARRFAPAKPEEVGDHYLIVSALTPYKGVDLAIRAFNRSRRKLVIIGKGEDRKRLESLAGDSIEFRGWRQDDEVASAMARCRGLIMPNKEDFGIVPLEAMAAGRPVIALAEGGALETVVPCCPGESDSSRPPTGVLFAQPTEDSLLAAVSTLERNLDQFTAEACRARALEFDLPIFRRRVAALLAEEGVSLQVGQEN